MVAFVSISWLRFAGIRAMVILVIITSNIFPILSKLLSSSSKLNNYLSRRKSILLESPFDLILSHPNIITNIKYFAGANSDVNCLEFNFYDKVPKKNTQISCLSVLDTVREHLDPTICPSVAHRNNACNIFTEAYV